MRSGKYTANKKQTGFTLIELLVVIAVIALLLSILIPTIRLASSFVKQTVCLSNLRQIGMMTMMYAEDNNNIILPSARNSDPQLRYPDNQDRSLGGPSWYELLRQGRYFEYSNEDASILHCPLDPRDKGFCSYSSNRYLMGFTSPRNAAEQQFVLQKITSVKKSTGSLILLGPRGCIEEGDIGKVDGQWSMSGISVSEFLGAEGNTGSGRLGFYAGRHSGPRLFDELDKWYVSDLKLPFLLLDGHADVYKGQLECKINQSQAGGDQNNGIWEYDNIFIDQSPGGNWPVLKPRERKQNY